MTEYKGFLTDTDKEFLHGEREYTGENAKQMRYQRRRSIRERTQEAFRDFALLADDLSEQEREKIFATETPGEYRALEEDLAATIQFMYAGIGSEGRFRRVLKEGIADAELERLLPSSHLGLVSVRFEVEPTPAVDMEATAEHLKNSEVSKITGDDARAFLQAALAASNEFDSEFIDRVLENRKRMGRGDGPAP